MEGVHQGGEKAQKLQAQEVKYDKSEEGAELSHWLVGVIVFSVAETKRGDRNKEEGEAGDMKEVTEEAADDDVG